MNGSEIFNAYIVGLLVNIVAGMVCFFLIRKLFEWLPNSEELSTKFRAVKETKNAKDKITALTPLIFISFYWMFLANMLWIALYLVLEVLWWPELLMVLNIPQVNDFLNARIRGLTIGRSVLFVLGCVVVAVSFYRGARIARQCWEVYRSTDIERV